MPNNIYCDSCVFIAYFKAEPGRVEILEQMFEEIQNDKNRLLVTSAFSISEVAYIENEVIQVGDNREFRLRHDTENLLDLFWRDSSLIEMVDVQETLTREARKLMRQAALLNYSLRPPDALHLVSAQFVGATEFLTYDNLGRYAGMTGLTICEPYVTQPRLPGT